MTIFRRTICALFLSALLLLSGCGAAGTETPVVHLSIWTYYNGDQLSAFNRLVEEFNATVGAEQGILVEHTSQGSVSDLQNHVLSAAQGKVGAADIPNIFAAYTDTAYSLNQLGLVADLSPYFSQAELDQYVDSYLEEGRFSGDGSLRIFPTAKSVELFLLNKTDWETFAAATGATTDDFSTIEGLVATAKAYYEWTDSLTPKPNGGKAFFGRDAMANYMIIGAKQLGVDLITVEDGKAQLHFDHDVVRKLWDNYYIPFVKGYFTASGRFRSDDVKTGNALAFVGSSSGATFFPTQVTNEQDEQHSIEMAAFPAPQFADAAPYAVQQGAGLVVTTGSDKQMKACVTFLKWFTEDSRNISFSVDSGYLPVTKTANDMDAIQSAAPSVTPQMQEILRAAIDTVQNDTLYTLPAFSKGNSVRSILESAMSSAAAQARKTVEERLSAGMDLDSAAAEFLTDDAFEAWYSATLASLTRAMD